MIHAYRRDPELRAALKKFRQLSRDPGPVLFLGMGASYCASFGGSVLLQTHGRPSFSADAGEWLHYAQPVWNDAALSVLLTTSGESAELFKLMKAGADRALGLICNNPASTCWNLAKNKLSILAAQSTATRQKPTPIPPPPSSWRLRFSNVRGRTTPSERQKSLRAITAPSSRNAAPSKPFAAAPATRKSSAEAHTGAGFKHGPNLDVDRSHVAIIFALGRVAELGIKLAQECNRRGGKVVLISADDRPATDKLFPVRIDAVPEPWEAITCLLVAQALTLGMVERTGCRLPPMFQYDVMAQ